MLKSQTNSIKFCPAIDMAIYSMC